MYNYRFTDAQHHKFLLEFIKSMAKCYKDQDRAKDFILDLLHLDVPGLFVTDSEGSTSTLQSDILASSVPDEFSNFLTDYIQRSNLQETILGEVETIWVSTCIRICVCIYYYYGIMGLHVHTGCTYFTERESYTRRSFTPSIMTDQMSSSFLIGDFTSIKINVSLRSKGSQLCES